MTEKERLLKKCQYINTRVRLNEIKETIDEEKLIIGTSCYHNASFGNLVSITGDGGNAWGFYGNSYKKLAPSWDLYQYYTNNPDHLNEQELINKYIEEYYNHRLKNLNVEELLQIFQEKFGKKIILLCHELPSGSDIITKKHFCHRRVFADFMNLKTGMCIPEIAINKLGVITFIEQPDYKPILKKWMKE